jgi:hypothetical protein
MAYLFLEAKAKCNKVNGFKLYLRLKKSSLEVALEL